MAFKGFVILLCTLVIISAAEPSAKKIKEVRITGGKAAASTFYNSGWSPEKGFVPNGPHGWHTGPPSKPEDFPVMIWYEFRRPILPAEVSFRGRQDGNSKNEWELTPSRFEIVGSNDVTCDKYATWTILCEDLSDKSFQSKFETRFCKVKDEINETFRCVGLRVLGTHNKHGWCSVNNIRMWEKV